MSKQQQQQQQPLPRRRPTRSPRGLWIIVAVAVVIAVAAVAAISTGGKKTAPDQVASAALMAKVTSVPSTVFDAVGAGSAQPAPTPVDTPALTSGGKPEILYMGAEYCPYCATERWAMVVALSRFGTFTGLRTTHSAGADVFPNTATFSFHGATYQSRWISFTGVEMESNVRQGDGYAPLDTATSAQQAILTTYDRAPYIGTSSTGGGIPFIDFGGKFLVSGATFDPAVLQGKSADEIATALSDPTSKIALGAVGAANTFTAAICTLTHNQPTAVCASPAVTKLQASR